MWAWCAGAWSWVDFGSQPSSPALAVAVQVQGHLAEMAVSHTGSRIVQACIKFGSEEQRQAVRKEVAPVFLELAKSSYGHFVASKLVATASKTELAGGHSTCIQERKGAYSSHRHQHLLRLAASWDTCSHSACPQCSWHFGNFEKNLVVPVLDTLAACDVQTALSYQQHLTNVGVLMRKLSY